LTSDTPPGNRSLAVDVLEGERLDGSSPRTSLLGRRSGCCLHGLVPMANILPQKLREVRLGRRIERKQELGLNDFAKRSTKEVLEDHLRCRRTGDIEADLERNYAPDVVLLTARGSAKGHDGVREFHQYLQQHVPKSYEIPLKLVDGPYAYIEWCARETGKSVEDGADSFVIQNGRIVFQSIHYSLQEVMPG
jgi:hypothetical protein